LEPEFAGRPFPVVSLPPQHTYKDREEMGRMIYGPGEIQILFHVHFRSCRSLDRGMEQNSFSAIQHRLVKAQGDLDVLISDVSHFVDFWLAVKIALNSLETVIPQIALDGSNPLRTDTVRRRWQELERQCFDYAFQVGRSLVLPTATFPEADLHRSLLLRTYIQNSGRELLLGQRPIIHLQFGLN
jgi:hypothetical protein